MDPTRHRSAQGGFLFSPALAALGLALVVSGSFVTSALVAAQPVDPQPLAGQPTAAEADAAFLPATGYGVSNPAFMDFFRKRGGLQTFGYPVSNEFTLLGTRVQIFQRQVLQIQPDGSVGSLNLLDEGLLPVTRLNGSTFPAPDPALAAAVPPPGSPDYHERALTFLAETAPDEWEGLPVNFGAAVRRTVTCADAFPEGGCDEGLLPALALQIWGLPTSRPAFDPANRDFVYQRFQRGILHYDRGCDCTQGLLLGDWFKRVLLGSNLPAGLAEQVAGSPFLAQYAPGAPAGLARPAELPGTVLAGAFGPEVGVSFPPAPPTPTSLPTSTPTGTPVPQPGVGTPTPVVVPMPATPTPSFFGTPDLCLGDEQMVFVPPKPYIGTDVVVAVTSARQHDRANVRLTGPVKTGEVRERLGLNGWVWEWTVMPTIEGWYEFTFYVDGARRCATAGFNALPPFGATATPTPTPAPTNTPLPTTPTNTPLPTATPTALKPEVHGFSPPSSPATGATCGDLLAIGGTNFGNSSQGIFSGTVESPPGSNSQHTARLYFGSSPVPSTAIVNWKNTEINFYVPFGLRGGQPLDVVIAVGNETSVKMSYTLRASGNCAQ